MDAPSGASVRPYIKLRGLSTVSIEVNVEFDVNMADSSAVNKMQERMRSSSKKSAHPQPDSQFLRGGKARQTAGTSVPSDATLRLPFNGWVECWAGPFDGGVV